MLEGLRQWAFALVLAAMAGGIAAAVSNSPNMKKYIKFACAITALAVMAAPINGLFRGLPDIFNYSAAQAEETYNPEIDFDLRRIIIEKSAEILEHRISGLIEQKTGIKPENIYIYSNINNKNTGADVQVEIEKAVINMPGNSADLGQVQAYLQEILDCVIIIE